MDTIPPPRRAEPPDFGRRARPQLDAWLDFYRATLLVKCAGLTFEQLDSARRSPPSDLSLLGLLRHMTHVEQLWFEDASPA